MTGIEWGSLAMAFPSKFGYMQSNILSYYGLIPVPYGDWE